MIHIARKISVGLLCLSSLVGSTALAAFPTTSGWLSIGIG